MPNNKCSKCGRDNDVDAAFCGFCGVGIKAGQSANTSPAKAAAVEIEDEEEAAEPVRGDKAAVEKRYPALRVIIGYYHVLAGIVAVVTILICGVLLIPAVKDGNSIMFAAILAMLCVGGILYITLRAFAEGISVFIDIEANTRKAAGK